MSFVYEILKVTIVENKYSGAKSTNFLQFKVAENKNTQVQVPRKSPLSSECTCCFQCNVDNVWNRKWEAHPSASLRTWWGKRWSWWGRWPPWSWRRAPQSWCSAGLNGIQKEIWISKESPEGVAHACSSTAGSSRHRSPIEARTSLKSSLLMMPSLFWSRIVKACKEEKQSVCNTKEVLTTDGERPLPGTLLSSAGEYVVYGKRKCCTPKKKVPSDCRGLVGWGGGGGEGGGWVSPSLSLHVNLGKHH